MMNGLYRFFIERRKNFVIGRLFYLKQWRKQLEKGKKRCARNIYSSKEHEVFIRREGL